MGGIEGVLLTDLKTFPDERGVVMHMMRSDTAPFKEFGEIYFSGINPGVIKGWKLHTRATGNLAVPVGSVRFVLHDTRPDSPTHGQFQDVVIGEENYKLLSIPPGVVYAWQNLSEGLSLVANLSSEPWAPDESQNLPFEKYDYDWEQEKTDE